MLILLIYLQELILCLIDSFYLPFVVVVVAFLFLGNWFQPRVWLFLAIYYFWMWCYAFFILSFFVVFWCFRVFQCVVRLLVWDLFIFLCRQLVLWTCFLEQPWLPCIVWLCCVHNFIQYQNILIFSFRFCLDLFLFSSELCSFSEFVNFLLFLSLLIFSFNLW